MGPGRVITIPTKEIWSLLVCLLKERKGRKCMSKMHTVALFARGKNKTHGALVFRCKQCYGMQGADLNLIAGE